MRYCDQRVSTWGGLRLFQQALAATGLDLFPQLHRSLPDANGGIVPAPAAVEMRRELDRFKNALPTSVPALVDARSGRVVWRRIDVYDGIQILSGRAHAHIGIDVDGFFVRDATTHAELFRSTHFRKRRGAYVTILQDMRTGEELRLESSLAFGEDDDSEAGLAEFVVQEATLVPADFDFILNALMKLTDASVATGNPIRWC
jgi:hypothetical protein